MQPTRLGERRLRVPQPVRQRGDDRERHMQL
jgi:hypothetical protein